MSSTRATPAVPETIVELLDRAAELFDGRIFLRDEYPPPLTFSALRQLARRAARACMALGVESGDRVAIWSPNCREWIIAALGAQLAGAILVPLNTRFKGTEAAWILNRSGSRLLFCVSEFVGNDYLEMLDNHRLPDLQQRILLRGNKAPGCHGWQDFLDCASQVSEATLDNRLRTINGDQILDMMFTSGTTGHPKGVLTNHRQNIRVYTNWGNTVGLNSQDNYLIINPFFHSFGYKAGWLAALIHGCQIVPVDRFDVPRTLADIASYRISFLPGPPTIFHSLLAAPQRSQYDLGSLRLAVTGAATVPVELIRLMRTELGFDSVLTAYGLTESCGVVTVSSADDSPEIISSTAGRALPGVELRCIDSDGKDVATGQPGELMIRGYNVMCRYFDAPQETAAAIDADGWLHSGDVATIDPNGYVTICDRIKDMFICGGFNCYPAEIENMLCELPGVAQAAVIGIADQRLGEVGAAFIIRAGSGDCGDAEAVIAECRRTMANYKVPRHVRFVENLPVNAAGKVLKRQLREQF